MKTAEQIVNERLALLDFGHSDPEESHIDPVDMPQFITDALRDGWFSGEDVIRWMREAVEADRAQHDLGYARQVIDRNNGRAVIWERGDVEVVVQELIDDEHIHKPRTSEEFDALVDKAMESTYWRLLDDPSESDWELIRYAVKEAAGDE